MKPYNCNYSQFDFKLHNENYHYYCEVIIDETGKVHYAHPSHQEFLINKACEKLKINRQELYEKCPKNMLSDCLEWLMKLTNCICVWYNFYNGKPNKAQIKSLKKLQNEKCTDFKKAIKEDKHKDEN